MSATATPTVSALDVLAVAAEAGVSVALSGDGQILVHPPPMGPIPDDVRALLRSHRQELAEDLERRRVTGDHPSVAAFLCVQCQQRYPADGQPGHRCLMCRKEDHDVR